MSIGGGVMSGGGAVTVSVASAVCVVVPTALALNLMSPTGVSYAVWMVSVLGDPVITIAGLNVAVTPLGRPVALSVTDCAVLPAPTLVAIMNVADVPAIAVAVAGVI